MWKAARKKYSRKAKKRSLKRRRATKGERVQDVESKPWKSEELKQLEEDMPRRRENDIEKVARSCKAKTGVGCDGFRPKVSFYLTREIRDEVVEFWEKVEQCGKWPQQACTTMFFLVPKNGTSEHPIVLFAHDDSLVGRSESAGGGETTIQNSY